MKIPGHLTVINGVLGLGSHRGPHSLWADSLFSSGYLRNAVAVWERTAGGLASSGQVLVASGWVGPTTEGVSVGCGSCWDFPGAHTVFFLLTAWQGQVCVLRWALLGSGEQTGLRG